MASRFFSIKSQDPRNLLPDWIARLVPEPPPANSTTNSDAHPLGYGDHMINLIFGFIYNGKKFIIGQSPAI